MQVDVHGHAVTTTDEGKVTVALDSVSFTERTKVAVRGHNTPLARAFVVAEVTIPEHYGVAETAARLFLTPAQAYNLGRLLVEQSAAVVVDEVFA